MDWKREGVGEGGREGVEGCEEGWRGGENSNCTVLKYYKFIAIWERIQLVLITMNMIWFTCVL